MEATLDTRIIDPDYDERTHLCLDAAFDSSAIRAELSIRNITSHIRSRHKEREEKIHACCKPRRWVVERCHSWMNRFRRLLIRWEKQAANHLAMIRLAYATICFQQA